MEDIHTIVQGLLTQGYDMEGLAQAYTVLTIQKSAVMAQLAQMTVTMNTMKAQLKTLASVQNNQAIPKTFTARVAGEISLTGANPS